MDISWPGLIIGTLLIAACLFVFRKRDAISGFVSSRPELFFGERMLRRVDMSPEPVKAALLLPMFGGIALGSAMVILSLTGVMA